MLPGVLKMKDKLETRDKYELYIENPSPSWEYMSFCGIRTEQQVEDFLKESSKFDKMPETCCFSAIKYLCDNSSRILEISFDNNKSKCGVDSCLWNLKHGKCTDKVICDIVGKILFTKAYSK